MARAVAHEVETSDEGQRAGLGGEQLGGHPGKAQLDQRGDVRSHNARRPHQRAREEPREARQLRDVRPGLGGGGGPPAQQREPRHRLQPEHGADYACAGRAVDLDIVPQRARQDENGERAPCRRLGHVGWNPPQGYRLRQQPWRLTDRGTTSDWLRQGR